MPKIAVIDVETTGLNPYRYDRIVEVAAVVIEPDGTLIGEFASLVNPGRDIGPTSIHGLTGADISDAPTFAELAGALVQVLHGSVAIAGHNIRFDNMFLSNEFRRCGHHFPECPTVCTMMLAGGGDLTTCCADYGVPYGPERHSAWHDAKATAELLVSLLADAPGEMESIARLSPVTWPDIKAVPVCPLTRKEASRRQQEPPTYLQRLLSRVQSTFAPDTDASAELAYMALLDRVLEDRRVADAEAEMLVDLADRWGLGGTRIHALHERYLCQLAAAALADGVVTASERRDLTMVARLLGVEDAGLATTLENARNKLLEVAGLQGSPRELPCGEPFAGKTVCFTGECQCQHQGALMTREVAMKLAAERGLRVLESVTKKLDMLVVADPLTESGKAKKARQYGIRILHEPVFWQTLGVPVE